MKPSKTKVKMVLIVRDQDGNPKVDNYPNCSKAILEALTEKDKEYLDGINSH